jgi:hypothetical protein
MTNPLKNVAKPIQDRLYELKALVTVSCEPETEVRPEDDLDDKEALELVREQLASGNEWAWCTVRVHVAIGDDEAFETLGCCSYEDQEDFQDSGYYEDMLTACLDRIEANDTQDAYEAYKARKAESDRESYKYWLKRVRAELERTGINPDGYIADSEDRRYAYLLDSLIWGLRATLENDAMLALRCAFQAANYRGEGFKNYGLAVTNDAWLTLRLACEDFINKGSK